MQDEKEATLADVVSELRDVQSSLKDVGKWVRFQNAPRLRDVLLKELDTPQKKVGFELTDGEHSRRDIAKEIGIDDDTVDVQAGGSVGRSVSASLGSGDNSLSIKGSSKGSVSYRGGDGVAARYPSERIAVGRGARHLRRGERAGRAGLRLDHDLLAELPR